MKTKIIYEDESILVVHKCAGLATQTARVGQQDVVSELKNYLAGKQPGKAPYLGVIHRLDQPVEGLLVFAKKKDCAAKLTSQLSEGTLNKQYYAVLCGKPSVSEGELVDYLIKENSGQAKVVTGQQEQYPDAKCARLQYQILRDAEPFRQSQSLHGTDVESPCEELQASEMESIGAKPFASEITMVDIHIDTGRFHQIRAQMAHAGFPLLGDSKYGTTESVELSQNLGVRQVALCAYKLELQHPITKKKLSFQVEPQNRAFLL